MSLFELSPEEFALLSTVIGFLLLPGLNTNQQNSLGNFLMGVGQVLETAAAQQAVVSPNGQSTDALAQLNRLEQRLAAIEQQINNP